MNVDEVDSLQSITDAVSLSDCLRDDGSLDIQRYRSYLQQEDAEEDNEEAYLCALHRERETMEAEATSSASKKPRTRRSKSIKPYYFDADGNKVTLKPRQTVCKLVLSQNAREKCTLILYLCYIAFPSLDCAKFCKKFRRRFRMPYQEYLGVLAKAKANDAFRRWRSKDAVGIASSPIELLTLGVLRYLGRGLTFDDLEEMTAIHEETHRQFFHTFIDFGANILYPLYVKMPQNAEEFADHRKEFNVGGLTGAGWSTDATNVVMWRCSHNLKQANMGFKQSHPARTYNMTCNHRREILHTTKGHPSRWNDKTLAHFDEFMNSVYQGRILQDVRFRLFSWEGDVGSSRLESTTYADAWGLVDNGYHHWACTQAPSKLNLMRSKERLSQWIESVRTKMQSVALAF
ncbi:unknown protein [Seminavis robusta]|uniref:Uncharacterized protein n=1 Tax=Seminavis robusta TaxID=568900 RepID=A0A9N8HWW4_9STRA|nr:unknown protein [Seminavis robusta]|eukprot:Sro2819_g337850.1 n/a (403) ;mRNA; f:2209-3757